MKTLAVLALLLLLLGAPFYSSAQAVTNSLNMQVYADGLAAIVQSISVSASDVSITIPLLSSIITNVATTDQNRSPLSFQISGGNITPFLATLASKRNIEEQTFPHDLEQEFQKRNEQFC